MKVIKRNGETEALSIDKIKKRLQTIANEFDLKDIDVDVVVQETVRSIKDGMQTKEIDEVTSLIASHKSDTHPQYGQLAAKVFISDLHKSTPSTFSKAMEAVQSILDPAFYKFITKNKKALNALVQSNRDYDIDYFGMKTFVRSYLLKNTEGVPQERPQYLFLRVSLALHYPNMEETAKSYDMMSRLLFTHATPTLFNAGTLKPSLASCYLLGTEDSIEGMYRTVSQCAILSKACGGIGLHMSNVRGSGSLIKSTNGRSTGIVPYLRVLNSTAKHVNQGGKRPGSIAIYLEPWHVDILAFLDLRKNTGSEEARSRDLFTALWVPDLFMEKVRANDDWYLFSADEAPLLNETYGAEFEAHYNRYVEEKKYHSKIKAVDIWRKALVSLFETGTPYISFKDRMNEGCTQKNLGILKSSNLCHEITLVSDHENVQVCVLGSIALSKMIKEDEVDYDCLYDTAYQLCVNLNRVIDLNFYPLKEAEKTALRDRPIGIGVQGFADMLYKLKHPFESIDAMGITNRVHMVIYHAAIRASIDLAILNGKTYDSFEGSPWQEGLLQFDLIKSNSTKCFSEDKLDFCSRLNWDVLKEDLKKHGLYNSTLTAMMPTASSSILLGNYESFEPPTSMIMKRQTNSGDFIVFNQYLVKDLIRHGLFTPQVREAIIRDVGSIQSIKEIPSELKELYKTAFEIDQSSLVTQSCIRQLYTDQAQSFNLFLSSVDFNRLNKLLFQGWRGGLKSGIYYLRSRSLHRTDTFTLAIKKPEEPAMCVYDPTKPSEGCESCSG